MDSDEEVRKEAEEVVEDAKREARAASYKEIVLCSGVDGEEFKRRSHKTAKEEYDRTYQHHMVDAKIEAKRKAQAAYDHCINELRVKAIQWAEEHFADLAQDEYDRTYRDKIEEGTE